MTVYCVQDIVRRFQVVEVSNENLSGEFAKMLYVVRRSLGDAGIAPEVYARGV